MVTNEPPSRDRGPQTPILATLLALVLLRGGAATAARPKPRREQKRTRRLRDAASWLSEASRLHMSSGAAPEDVLHALEAALAVDPLHT